MRIEIRKSAKKLELLEGNDLIKSFEVAFGFASVGSKEVEGDGKTPEGEYFVCVKNPKSKFHLSLGLNYPNKKDAERGLTAGLISKAEHDTILAAVSLGELPPQHTPLGGEIYIHGGGADSNWTRGCISLTDDEMTELYEAIPVGTPVHILP